MPTPKVYSDEDFCETAPEVISCINCGGFGPTQEQVDHYPTCKPGEGKRWERYYDRAAAEEELLEELGLDDL